MRKLIILSLAIFAVSCSRSYKEPIDAASSVAPSEISIGGVIAELKDSTQIPNNGNLNNQSDYQLRIKKLMTQAEAFKNKRKPMEQQAFQSEWKELNKQFMIHQEELSSEDVHVWMTLNDSLLLYSEDVAYADALERLVYNNLGKYAFTDKQLKSFVYTRRYDRIYLNLYGSSSMQYEHTTGGSIRLVQSTDYPFDGRITLKVELQDKRFLDLFVRIPAWASYASVTVKGVKYPVTPGKYSEVARMWKNGDQMDIVIGFNPVVVTRTKPNKSFALSYGSLMLTFPKTENDSLIYRGSDPVGQLRFVSPPGEMPTFTFTGMPDTTLVLQPYFVDQGNDNPRTAWIRQ